jgi:hypothetical protein
MSNGMPQPDDPSLAAALRACADGFYPAEAAAEFLIGHASWLCRKDLREGYVDVGTSITDGATTMAVIDWPAAIAALDGGGFPCSGCERRVLRLAASLADGIPVDLRDAFTGMDAAKCRAWIVLADAAEESIINTYSVLLEERPPPLGSIPHSSFEDNTKAADDVDDHGKRDRRQRAITAAHPP